MYGVCIQSWPTRYIGRTMHTVHIRTGTILAANGDRRAALPAADCAAALLPLSECVTKSVH